MDLVFCGIVDIVMVLILLLVLFIGYKKGFMEKFLSMSKILFGFIFAVIFCNSFAKTLIQWGAFYPSIYQKLYDKITSSDVLSDPSITASLVYQKLGIPAFFADILGKNITIDVATIGNVVADNVTRFFMIIIAFALLFFGTTIIFFILKGVVTVLRQSKFVRFVDGVFGMAFYSILYVAFLYVVFAILYYVIDLEVLSQVKAFLTIDMQLETEKFRISKYFFESNIIVNLINMFI